MRMTKWVKILRKMVFSIFSEVYAVNTRALFSSSSAGSNYLIFFQHCHSFIHRYIFTIACRMLSIAFLSTYPRSTHVRANGARVFSSLINCREGWQYANYSGWADGYNESMYVFALYDKCLSLWYNKYVPAKRSEEESGTIENTCYYPHHVHE